MNSDHINTEEYFVDPIDAVKYEITAFIQSIDKRTGPIVKGEDGLRALPLLTRLSNTLQKANPHNNSALKIVIATGELSGRFTHTIL